jgi:BirA family biotin operon repressor/biotin-[acetyl-CoA-carboxylase] ligase
METRWIKYDSLASTNSTVSELLKQEKPDEGLVILADYQESGRGQGENVWHSKRGENLLMSLLLYPAFLSASSQFQVSMLVSLALCDLLDSLGASPQVKWPNDILSSRGKMAGILIEHGIMGGKLSHSIVGIGLNLNQSQFPDFPVPATSLYLDTAKKTHPEEIAGVLLQHFVKRYDRLKENGAAELEKAYLERLFRAGELSGFTATGESFKGIIRGVNEFGELQVEREGQIETFGHGEISFDWS